MSPKDFLINTQKMTDFRPFRAFRYNPGKVDPRKVIAPPYDVISPAEQKRLYERDPHNCIRLILNAVETGDGDSENAYTRARDFFNSWTREGTLIREDAPAFYLYRQRFPSANGEELTRIAIIGRLRLEPFESGVVVPHENTLAKPVEDRTRLLKTTQTNLSPIFGLYEDESNQMTGLIGRYVQEKPIFEVQDDRDIWHGLWAIGDEVTTDAIRTAMSEKKVYIADGHHRYRTALEYSRQCDGKKAGEELSPEDFVLMALVAFEDPGMVLLPTHRLLKKIPVSDSKKALEALQPYFKVESMAPADLTQKLENEKDENVTRMGLLLGADQGYLLTLEKVDEAIAKMPAGKPDFWYKLDVNVLAYLVFEQLWDFPPSKWESNLIFTHSTDEAFERVCDGEAAAGFFLGAPKVQILRDMGKAGELMPQKSTYFYPKLASGLVFYHHSE
ncbi:MAG: DUF1015 domain-containing protein [Candidatus Omnitrophota bacterium]|nr:DUF1015 domain-containing protein [Candidatus Omnitrophota bacterium]